MTLALVVSLAVTSLELQPPTPYDVNPVLDGTVTVGSFALIYLMHNVAGGSLENDYICSERNPDVKCDPANVNRFDRGAIRNNSKTWDDIGSYGLFVIGGGALLTSILDNALADGDQKLKALASDVTVIAEAAGLATLTAHTIRFGIRRPRPTQYEGGSDIEMSDVERHLSFPSGHAASVGAIATAAATTFWLRHPDSPWRWVAAGGSVALAGVSNYGRVGAGRHFPSDVIAGQLIGTVFGILIPLAHRADVNVFVSAGETKSLTLAGTF
jgi:membrane-associated phospholipid phosphatase